MNDREILCQQTIADFIDANMLFWAGSVSTMDGLAGASLCFIDLSMDGLAGALLCFINLWLAMQVSHLFHRSLGDHYTGTGLEGHYACKIC